MTKRKRISRGISFECDWTYSDSFTFSDHLCLRVLFEVDFFAPSPWISFTVGRFFNPSLLLLGTFPFPHLFPLIWFVLSKVKVSSASRAKKIVQYWGYFIRILRFVKWYKKDAHIRWCGRLVKLNLEFFISPSHFFDTWSVTPRAWISVISERDLCLPGWLLRLVSPIFCGFSLLFFVF